MMTATNDKADALELRDFTGATMDVVSSGDFADIEVCTYSDVDIIEDVVFLLSAEDAASLIDWLSEWLEARHGILGHTERLLALYGNEIGVQMTLEQLINSHRSQREIVAGISNDLIQQRRDEIRRQYAGYDQELIASLQESINDLLGRYARDVALARAEEAQHGN